MSQWMTLGVSEDAIFLSHRPQEQADIRVQLIQGHQGWDCALLMKWFVDSYSPEPEKSPTSLHESVLQFLQIWKVVIPTGLTYNGCPDCSKCREGRKGSHRLALDSGESGHLPLCVQHSQGSRVGAESEGQLRLSVNKRFKESGHHFSLFFPETPLSNYIFGLRSMLFVVT